MEVVNTILAPSSFPFSTSTTQFDAFPTHETQYTFGASSFVAMGQGESAASFDIRGVVKAAGVVGPHAPRRVV
ncbi:hypothetical protein CC2G_007933 [Coprinopsis cinerea AmutBmut pab1-1]|nr:hypothetical protein CC2G_007933 [Coprinopsis cinerea AmutBmut pab1-1]